MDLPHHLVSVFRGRCDCHRPTQRADRLNKAERVGEGSDTPGINQLLKAPLLFFGIDHGLPLGLWHTQCLKGSTGAAEARFARNMGLVHRGGEAIWIREASESFAPSPLMRGCE